ncbi:hypothetical protein NE865_11251 [Phthorimaea operculella]|nr:hypothetical protein NE865_11251 [Phthorimaea operculella]
MVKIKLSGISKPGIVRSALPAIDDRAPAERPHVTTKLKKCQRESDRKDKIQKDNFSLLQRLNAIMKVNRLDNHWVRPLPNFKHKVGLFYDVESLQTRLTGRSLIDESHESSYSNVKCYACEIRKKTAGIHRGYQESLPSIYSN